MTAVRFLLNGEWRTEDAVAPTMTVLDWLRTRARLTGTKEGCAEGDCGACTIAIRSTRHEDARYTPVNSCLMLAPQLHGCEVVTIEGLSPRGGPLHPVQQALIDADATQCGFCTPGFVMAMFAAFDGREPIDDWVIHDVLAGNLCRCTGYRSIVDACRKVAAEMRDFRDVLDDSKPVVRPSRPAKGGPRRTQGAESNEYTLNGQTFHAPTSLSELLELRARFPDAVLLAGGTDLGLRVSKDREAWPRVISTASVAELKRITADGRTLGFGGAVTYAEALPYLDEHFGLGAFIRRIGSRQIRAVGTLAGNLATASPIGDMLPSLMVLGAEVRLASVGTHRSLLVEDFITGYRRTALAPDEIIEAIRIPFLEPAGRRFFSEKLSKRYDQDISTIVAAGSFVLDAGRVANVRVVFGGMAATPKRARYLEQALIGRTWLEQALEDVEVLLARDVSPLSDHRASAAYRLRAAAGLLRRIQFESAGDPPLTRVMDL